MVGETLGHYRILDKLGAGGMGDVYRARDTRLDRDVAIKVLPEAVARDPERLARFEREAKVLASLNHPHIGAIYGLEMADGQPCLILELIEGETLAERIARNRLSVTDTVEICRQIAEALEAAHEHGIVHRDLKPANIKVTPGGQVKVLDFGLAKPIEAEPSRVDLSHSPTITAPMTQTGVLLGTAAYMSPEQVRGEEASKQADVWAFGCVLFEALTGRPAFLGSTISDTIAHILERDPDWSALPEETPPLLRILLHRCLQKDTRDRLHDIGDARIEIREASESPTAISGDLFPPQPASRARRFRAMPWILLSLLAAAVLVALTLWGPRRDGPAEPEPTRRFVAALPQGQTIPYVGSWGSSVMLSRNGQQLVYVAKEGDKVQLYQRSLDAFDAEPIPGTEGGVGPFLSPDGAWLGFYARGDLKKVPLTGGAPSRICTVEDTTYRGGTWGEDNQVVYAKCSYGLRSVPAAGGEAGALTTVTDVGDDLNHIFPQHLPGGEEVLFTVYNGPADSRIVVRNLFTGDQKTVIEPGTYGRYLPSGHLIYGWQGEILAVPFDLESLTPRGLPVRVVESVLMDGKPLAAHFSVADNGTLAYVPGGLVQEEDKVVWVDHDGQIEPLAFPASESALRISPDGRQMLISRSAAGETGLDLWICNLERGTERRLAVPGQEFWAVWAPDSLHVVYNSGRHPNVDLYMQAVDGSGPETLVAESEHWLQPFSVSPGGLLAYQDAGNPETGFDIWVTSLEAGAQPEPFLRTKHDEFHPAFSPDGRWLAYVSSESGRWEVYVRPYPGPGGVEQASIQGGAEPVWSPDGREIHFRWNRGKQVFTVSVALDGQDLRLGKPRLLFEGDFTGMNPYGRGYDLSPDGKRFLMMQKSELPPPPTQFNIVLNWFSELERLVPTSGG